MGKTKIVKDCQVTLKEPILTNCKDGTLGYVKTVGSDELILVEKDGQTYVLFDYKERPIYLPVRESFDSLG